MRWLELNIEGVVTNIVVWDGVSEYAPLGVAQLLSCSEHPGVSFGWRKVEDGWEAPPHVELLDDDSDEV
jgi:hypothetical protein